MELLHNLLCLYKYNTLYSNILFKFQLQVVVLFDIKKIEIVSVYWCLIILFSGLSHVLYTHTAHATHTTHTTHTTHATHATHTAHTAHATHATHT